MRSIALLVGWLNKFPKSSEISFECSIYGDDALLIVKTPSGEFHNSEEIEGFHKDREKRGPI